MAILTEDKEDIQQGIAKVIDDSGIKMLFDTFQKYQYSNPIKSTVRELLSNGVDSVAEKAMARAILSGQAKVSDYYADIQGDLYKDSKWNPDYYDLKWLSDTDSVSLTYAVGQNMEKDKVIISDNGVGLGGKRLEGYFKLAYSSKRLQKQQLGKWGVGAKAAFSLGIPFYTVENRYNGKLFRFNIYSQSFTSIIGKFNMETGETNDFVIFNEGTEDAVNIYYEKTDSKNGVTITIDAKTHHRGLYIDAVKSQMLYFDNISCQELEQGRLKNIDYKAKILYEDDYIIMSDNNYYTQPHLLLNKVNYGFIDWTELELETKKGNIGIKVAPEDVDVNPSREAVIWNDFTKKMVLERFNKVVEIASDLIQKELQDTDLVKWLRSCYAISGKNWGNSGGVLGRLANIVDLSKVEPRFGPNPKLGFRYTKPLPGIYMRYVERAASYYGKDTDKEFNRFQIESLQNKLDRPLFLFIRGERASNRKDKYLYTLYPNGFTLIHEPYRSREEMDEDMPPQVIRDFYEKSDVSIIWAREVWDMLCMSTEVMRYDEVEVPESFNVVEKVEKIEEEEVEEEPTEEEVQQTKLRAMSAADRRKAEGKTIIHMVETLGRLYDTPQGKKAYEFTKLEVPVKLINDWEGEVYYGNDVDTEMLHLTAMLTRDPGNELGTLQRRHAKDSTDWKNSKWYRLNKNKLESYGFGNTYEYKAFPLQHFFDNSVTLIKVAQSSNKLYRDFKHVQSFYFQIKNKTTITMSNKLVQWNTARIIKDKLWMFAFLYNFEEFNPEYAAMYESLCQYVNKNYREVEQHNGQGIYGLSGDTYTDLISHLDNVRKFQDFVRANPDPQKISELAKELFSNPELRDGMAVDPEVITLLDKLLEFSIACGEMLNYIPALTGQLAFAPSRGESTNRSSKMDIPATLSMEIRAYLEYRGADKFKSISSGLKVPKDEEE